MEYVLTDIRSGVRKNLKKKPAKNAETEKESSSNTEQPPVEAAPVGPSQEMLKKEIMNDPKMMLMLNLVGAQLEDMNKKINAIVQTTTPQIDAPKVPPGPLDILKSPMVQDVLAQILPAVKDFLTGKKEGGDNELDKAVKEHYLAFLETEKEKMKRSIQIGDKVVADIAQGKRVYAFDPKEFEEKSKEVEKENE